MTKSKSFWQMGKFKIKLKKPSKGLTKIYQIDGNCLNTSVFLDQGLQEFTGKISILQTNFPLQVSNQQALYTIYYSNKVFICIKVMWKKQNVGLCTMLFLRGWNREMMVYGTKQNTNSETIPGVSGSWSIFTYWSMNNYWNGYCKSLLVILTNRRTAIEVLFLV